MRVMVNTRFLVCVAKDADFGGKQKQIAANQRKVNVAGDSVRIFGKVYVNLAGTVSLANSNEAIRLGMTRGQFMTEYFNDSGGFRFSFEGSLEKMRFSWQGVSTRSDDVMFFGQKFTGGCLYNDLLRWKGDRQYAHHVFRQFASEVRGDASASSQLYASYQKRLRRTFENKNTELLALQTGVFDKQSFNDTRGKLFRKLFDDLCRYAFFACMSSLQDYSQPIICNDNFMNYLALAKSVFDPPWRFLASLRNIDPKNETDKLTAYTERQVFCQIMALRCVCIVAT